VTCFDTQVIRRMTAFQLDECGRIPTEEDNPAPALKGLEDALQTFTRTRNVDVPADNFTKVVSGRTCTKPRPSPTDRGYQVALTFCGGNPVFEAITGYRTLDFSGEDIVGWEDRELTGTNRVALEVIFEPSVDSCAIGEAAQCIAVLIPQLEQWVKSGDETADGETVPDLQMQAQTALNANLFANYATSAELPDYLDHWAPKFDDISTGRSWVYTRLIDCPTVVPSDGCTLTAIDEAS
jgi:hypothetical protein